MTDVYVSLGSNSEDADQQLPKALDALGHLPGVCVAAVSPVYRTEPQDLREQPWFLNQVARLSCDPQWTAPALLKELLAIEAALGRVRSMDPALRFGPRRIDLDLLLFGNASSSDTACLVPHPRMLQRAFVLVPLRDIAPQVILANGKTPEETLLDVPYSLQADIIYQ